MRFNTDKSAINLFDEETPYEEPEENPFISDSDSAVSLIGDILTNSGNKTLGARMKIRQSVERIFRLFSEVSFDEELEYYNRMLNICERLAEQQKIKSLQDKTIVGMGGQFSAGKSKFINSITGMEGLLPEAQGTTTAIPTYVIFDENKSCTANLIDGASCELTDEKLQALTHEFYTTHNIGFASFIESIIIHVPEFKLDKSIAILDTPGYSKYDDKSDARTVMSDNEKSAEQLGMADFVIWLVAGGELMEDDINFLRNLDLGNPILLVLNKADQRTDEDNMSIIEQLKKTVEENDINCFGVAGYSSLTGEEVGGNEIIGQFFKTIAESKIQSGNIYKKLLETEEEIRKSLDAQRVKYDELSVELFDNICGSVNISGIASLTDLWSYHNCHRDKFKDIIESYDFEVKKLNEEVSNFIAGGQNSDNE